METPTPQMEAGKINEKPRKPDEKETGEEVGKRKKGKKQRGKAKERIEKKKKKEHEEKEMERRKQMMCYK